MKKKVHVIWCRYATRDIELDVEEDFDTRHPIEQEAILRMLAGNEEPEEDCFDDAELVEAWETK